MKGFYIIFLAMIFSCSIPSGDTASFSYIDIEKMNLNGGNADFRDAWIFIDGQSYGVYELPRKIALVNKEIIEATIQAGIRENGISSSPRVYPFVDNFDIELSLKDGEEIQLEPIFNYLPSAKIRLDADFENQNLFGYNEDGIDSIKIELSGGNGIIALKGGELIEEATASVYSELPINGTPIYLEIEYKGNLDLDVGLIGISGGDVFKDYFVSLRSENEWKKAYINFTELVLASKLDGYQILLGVDNSTNSNEGQVYVDNIKLLHF